MKDFRLIEERAMELGIIPKDYTADLLFNKYKKTSSKIKERFLSDPFIESMIKKGQELGSYFDALVYYLEEGLIEEDDADMIKDTLFIEYLQQELEKKNMLKSNKNKLF